MKHLLKIKRVNYDRIEEGTKSFEVRFNDRNYQSGDAIEFKVIEDFPEGPEYGFYPGRVWTVVYIHQGLGMMDNYVVLSLKEMKHNV